MKTLQEQETVEKTPLWNIVPANPERGFTQVKIYAQEQMLLYQALTSFILFTNNWIEIFGPYFGGLTRGYALFLWG